MGKFSFKNFRGMIIKQMPMNAKVIPWFNGQDCQYQCPRCYSNLTYGLFRQDLYCSQCGQAIDYGGTKL